MLKKIKLITKTIYSGIKYSLPFGAPVYYSGIRVAKKRLLADKLFPSIHSQCENKPRYEETLLKAISKNVLAEDNVVIIGGGAGVTAIKAAIIAHKGDVTVYEGDKKSCSDIALATKYAKITNLKVINAIVQDDIGVYGATQNKSNIIIPATEIPKCDVLELDCEGAEINILRGLVFLPRVILVETHGFMGASTKEVHNQLSDLGYSITNLGIAEPDFEEFCLTNDIKILEAIRS